MESVNYGNRLILDLPYLNIYLEVAMDAAQADEVKKMRTAIYQRMSYAERWRQAVALRETAWTMKKAAVKYAHPEWSDAQIEKAVRDIFLYAST
jgi:hypothetical protein